MIFTEVDLINSVKIPVLVNNENKWELFGPKVVQQAISQCQWKLFDKHLSYMFVPLGQFGNSYQHHLDGVVALTKNTSTTLWTSLCHLDLTKPCEVYAWWKQWGHEPVALSTPVFKTMKTVSLTSQKIVSLPPRQTYPSSFVQALIDLQCFAMGSGQTLIMALHRLGRIKKKVMEHVLNQWIIDWKSSNPVYDCPWWIPMENTSGFEDIYMCNGASIGDHLEFYVCYGGAHEGIITKVIEQTPYKGPMFLRHHEESSITYFLSIPTVMYSNKMNLQVYLLMKKWQVETSTLNCMEWLEDYSLSSTIRCSLRPIFTFLTGSESVIRSWSSSPDTFHEYMVNVCAETQRKKKEVYHCLMMLSFTAYGTSKNKKELKACRKLWKALIAWNFPAGQGHVFQTWFMTYLMGTWCHMLTSRKTCMMPFKFYDLYVRHMDFFTEHMIIISPTPSSYFHEWFDTPANPQCLPVEWCIAQAKQSSKKYAVMNHVTLFSLFQMISRTCKPTSIGIGTGMSFQHIFKYLIQIPIQNKLKTLHRVFAKGKLYTVGQILNGFINDQCHKQVLMN